MTDLLVRNTGAVTTNDGPPVQGPAAIAIDRGRITWVGPDADIPDAVGDRPEIDAAGAAIIPGFVDPHTHLVFAGNRRDEFTARMSGVATSITAEQGGIMSTVAATRAATSDELARLTGDRLRHMVAHGTTTVEIKSGYGLDPAHEKRLLDVVAAVAAGSPATVVPTFLGAHVIPPEYRSRRTDYVDQIIDEQLLACAPLARFCDVFCDDGAFTVDEARRILTAAMAAGLKPKLHAEQLAHTGAAALAADLRAISADHLDHVDAHAARDLAAEGTVAVLLPGAAISMGAPPPPVEVLRRAGATMALATDCNPGTSYWLTMPMMVALAVLEFHLTPDEAIHAATRGGALAVDEPGRGRLRPGAPADLIILATDHAHDLAYRPDSHLIGQVVIGGKVVAGRLAS